MNHIVAEDIKYIINKMNYMLFNNSTVMITGATGFIARYFVYVLMYLNDTFDDFNCKIIALCRNEKKAMQLFKEYISSNSFELLIQDIIEPIRFDGLVHYVLHAASPSATGTHYTYPVETLTSNVIGTYNVLEFAKGHSEFRCMLFFSTGAVYGEGGGCEKPIDEKDFSPLDPLSKFSYYAEGKRTGESLCNAYFNEYGIASKIIRISHTYGPGIDLDDGHVYSDFVKSILNSSDLVIKGNGLQYRPFTYVADCVVAIFKIIEKGEVLVPYNMANNSAYVSIKELAEMLTGDTFEEKGLKVEIKNPSTPLTTVPFSVATTRLEEIGWKPYFNLREGFKRTVESFMGC